MGGNCDLAIGALATVTGGEISLDACLDGRRAHVRGREPLGIARAAAAELRADA